jgi:hypothetical protein
MSFQVHGDVGIQVVGQVIILNVTGPWNIELVQMSRKLTSPYITQVSERGNWGLIVQLNGSAMCPPDALKLIKEGADKDINLTKRICTSYAMSPETEGYNLMLPIWHDIYYGKIPFDIFDTLEEAQCWVSKQLASE